MSRILRSLAGRVAGTTEDGRFISLRGFVAGRHGNQLELPSPGSVVVFDDYLGDALNTDLHSNPTKGTDAQTVDFAVLAGQQSGFLRGTTGDDAAASMAVNGIAIHPGGLQWKANQSAHPRRLVFEARVRMSAITTMYAFLGLTDQITALEAPIESAGSVDTITTNASDAVGFFFDTRQSTDEWFMAGVAANVDAVHQASGFAPVAATFETLRVEVAPDGSAVFFRNGKQVGVRMAGAVTATVALAPVITCFSIAAASRTFDIDYVHMAADRV